MTEKKSQIDRRIDDLDKKLTHLKELNAELSHARQTHWLLSQEGETTIHNLRYDDGYYDVRLNRSAAKDLSHVMARWYELYIHGLENTIKDKLWELDGNPT